LMNSLEILFDVPWDPFLANWSDNLRTSIFGFWLGRRRPFLLVGAFLVVFFSIFLVQPPMSFGEKPPEGSGVGKHSFWRIVDCSLVDCHPGTATREGPNDVSGPWALREVEFYETGYISADTRVGGKPLSAASSRVLDGDEATAAGGANKAPTVKGSLGMSCLGSAREILNVRVLQHNVSDATRQLGVQYSDDGSTWHNPGKRGWEFEDETHGEWVTYGWHYTTVKSALWYGFFNVLCGTVAHSMREVPMEGLLAELSPDLGERTGIVIWKLVMQLVGLVVGSMSASVLLASSGGQEQCENTPWTGCAVLAPIVLTMGTVYLVSIIVFSIFVKERSKESLPPSEATQSIAEAFVAGYLNRPLRNLTFVGFVIAVGQGLSGPVLGAYYMKYVLNDRLIQERYGIDRYMLPMIMGLIMLVCMPVGFAVWTVVINRIGRFRSILWQLSLAAALTASFVLVGEGDLYLYLVFMTLIALVMSGLTLTFPTLTMDIVDYDEFLTGQRREAMIQMISPFCMKLAGLPTKVLPLMLLSQFGWDPRRRTQPAAAIYIIKLSMSVIPAMLFLPALYIFWKGFPMRWDAQKQKLDEGLALHRKGVAAADPYFAGSIVLPVEVIDGGKVLAYNGLLVPSSKANILQHFFPSELREALEVGSLQELRRRLYVRLAVAAVFVPAGLILAVTSFLLAATSSEESSGLATCTFGGLLLIIGSILAWFDGTRYIMVGKAVKEGVGMEDVRAVHALYEGFLAGQMVADREDSYLKPAVHAGYGSSGT